jgi:hypothetical protein
MKHNTEDMSEFEKLQHKVLLQASELHNEIADLNKLINALSAVVVAAVTLRENLIAENMNPYGLEQLNETIDILDQYIERQRQK